MEGGGGHNGRPVEMHADPEDLRRGFFSVYTAGRIPVSGRGFYGWLRALANAIAWVVYGRDHYVVKVDRAELWLHQWVSRHPTIRMYSIIVAILLCFAVGIYLTRPVTYYDTASVINYDGTVIENAVVDLYMLPASSPVMESLPTRPVRAPFTEGEIARGYYSSSWSDGRVVNISVVKLIAAMIGPISDNLMSKCMCGTFVGTDGLVVRSPYDNEVLFDPRAERRSTEFETFPWPYVPSVAPYVHDPPSAFEVPRSLSLSYIDTYGTKKTAVLDGDTVACITYCTRLLKLIREKRADV